MNQSFFQANIIIILLGNLSFRLSTYFLFRKIVNLCIAKKSCWPCTSSYNFQKFSDKSVDKHVTFYWEF